MNFFHIHDGSPLNHFRRSCIQSVKNIMVDGDTHNVYKLEPKPGVPFFKAADLMRIDILSQDPDAVYYDTDAYALKRPVFEKSGVAYMAEQTFRDLGVKVPDLYFLASNGCPEFFDMKKFGDGYDVSGYGMSMEFATALSGFEFMPEGFVLHPYMTAPHIFSTRNSVYKNDAAAIVNEQLKTLGAKVSEILRTLN